MRVIQCSRQEGLRILLTEESVNLACRDLRGRTPLHCAANKGLCFSVTVLLQKGADIRMVDRKGETPLDKAVQSGHVTVTKPFWRKQPRRNMALTIAHDPFIMLPASGILQLLDCYLSTDL
ncbi:uncharacterized protein BDW70DRAFT_146222, partial [Aspergillus foveolatus]|uniref:uncharacterized protein n=1 Tax=Aspergillus foveolatus TaxID=210207 RepID=UPI003CCD1884